MAKPETDELIEIYQTDSDLVARQIVDVLLKGEGINAVIHNRKVAMFPGAGQSGEFEIWVFEKDRERAAEIIAEAEDNGFLDAEDVEPTA